MSAPIYLDYAAATPMDERVLAAMQPYFSDTFYNPSSVYLASRGVKSDLSEARANVAHWLGARPSEITFTAGATEANNIAIHGVMADSEGTMLYSSIEHEAVIEPAQRYNSMPIPVDEHGLLKLEELAKQIDGQTRLVSVMYANNEIGTVQHMADIAQLIAHERARRREVGENMSIYLHTDASQAANYLDMHVDKLGVDLMTINGAKMYGPKQSGALYIRAGIELGSFMQGGGQEHGLRSGTENVAMAVGLAKALDMAQKMRKDESHRLTKIRDMFRADLISEYPDAQLHGHKKFSLPNIVSVSLTGIDGERVVMMLDEAGIMAATGSACSALRDESSHVIKAIGGSEDEARGTLRFSMGRQTTAQDIEMVLANIQPIIATARAL